MKILNTGCYRLIFHGFFIGNQKVRFFVGSHSMGLVYYPSLKKVAAWHPSEKQFLMQDKLVNLKGR